MPSAPVVRRNLVLTAALCAVVTLPTAVSARSPDCGAAPVIGRDGSILYWTGGRGCPAAAWDQGDSDSRSSQDDAAVSRNSTAPDAAPAPMPESRPVADAVTVKG